MNRFVTRLREQFKLTGVADVQVTPSYAPAVFAPSRHSTNIPGLRHVTLVHIASRGRKHKIFLFVRSITAGTYFSRNDFPTWVENDLAYPVALPPPQGFRSVANGSVQFPTLYHPPALIKLTGEMFIKHLLSATLGQRPLVLIDNCKCFTGVSLRSHEGIEAVVRQLGQLPQHGLPHLVAPLSPFPNGSCEPQVFYFFADSHITCMGSAELRGNGVGYLLNGTQLL